MRRNQQIPFVLWTSFPDPHHPFDAPIPWSKLHNSADVDLPRHRSMDLGRRPWWHAASLENTPQLADESLREFRARVSRVDQQTDGQLADLMANYYGMVSLIDHNVGRILSELQDLRLSGNTYVIFTSDHGDWLGDHGLVLKGPMPYEGLLRVPLLVSGPDIPRGHVVDAPVSTLDLCDTFLEWIDHDNGQASHGQSLQGLLLGTEFSRRYAHCEWNLHPSRCGVGLELRTVRSRSHKLTLELRSGAAEMYDLVTDPHEMINVAEDRQYADARRELESYIQERPKDAIDQLPEPVGMA